MAVLYILALFAAVLASCTVIFGVSHDDGRGVAIGLLLFLAALVMGIVQSTSDDRKHADSCQRTCLPYTVFVCNDDLAVCRTGKMKAEVRKLK